MPSTGQSSAKECQIFISEETLRRLLAHGSDFMDEHVDSVINRMIDGYEKWENYE